MGVAAHVIRVFKSFLISVSFIIAGGGNGFFSYFRNAPMVFSYQGNRFSKSDDVFSKYDDGEILKKDQT